MQSRRQVQARSDDQADGGGPPAFPGGQPSRDRARGRVPEARSNQELAGEAQETGTLINREWPMSDYTRTTLALPVVRKPVRVVMAELAKFFEREGDSPLIHNPASPP